MAIDERRGTLEGVLLAVMELDAAALRRVADAVVVRRKALRQVAVSRTMLLLRPGDRVRFTDEIRPQELGGLTAVVQRLNETTVMVVVDEEHAMRAGRFAGPAPIKCPAHLLERV
jgi:uncharacterized protein YkvS